MKKEMKNMLSNLKVQLILHFQKDKITSTERVYYPYIINDISYLYGALVMYDENTSKTVFIKIMDFGYDNEESVEEAKKQGFIFIKDSILLKDNMDAVDYRYTKIRKKDN